jgi:SAM-dependent methyltransferase
VAEQLATRVSGQIIAVDQDEEPLASLHRRTGARVHTVQADVHQLPFPDQSIDLIVSHFAFLWFRDPTRVIAEVARVLRANGAVALVEPDYGGLMEYPRVGLRERWISALQSQGADPFIGRRLPTLLAPHAFDMHVLFCDRYLPPSSDAYRFLLPLLPASQQAELTVHPHSRPETVFLPLWMAGGQRPSVPKDV